MSVLYSEIVGYIFYDFFFALPTVSFFTLVAAGPAVVGFVAGFTAAVAAVVTTGAVLLGGTGGVGATGAVVGETGEVLGASAGGGVGSFGFPGIGTGLLMF
jgi:hypothetical protein